MNKVASSEPVFAGKGLCGRRGDRDRLGIYILDSPHGDQICVSRWTLRLMAHVSANGRIQGKRAGAARRIPEAFANNRNRAKRAWVYDKVLISGAQGTLSADFPEIGEAPAELATAQGDDGIGPGNCPVHASALEPGTDSALAAGLDHPCGGA
jgi:hypothetical protein